MSVSYPLASGRPDAATVVVIQQVIRQVTPTLFEASTSVAAEIAKSSLPELAAWQHLHEDRRFFSHREQHSQEFQVLSIKVL